MKSSTARKAGKQNMAERKAEVFRQRLVIAGIAALVLLYLLVAIHYTWHFEPKSEVNGVDVSGLSLKAAKAKLAETAPAYALEVAGPGEERAKVTAAEIGFSIADASGAKTALRAQPALGWALASFRDKKYRVDLAAVCDEEALDAWMDSLPMLDESGMVPPSDASLKCDESGAYVIIPETIGTTLRTGEARKMIREAVGCARAEVDLTETLVLPEVYEDDPNLKIRRDEWNTWLTSAGLTYRVGDSEEVLDSKTIASLLTDDGEHVDLSYAKTADLLSDWQKAHDTYGRSFDFTTHSGKTVRIQPYGDYGFALDEEDTCADVMEKIRAHDRGTYDAEYYHRALYDDNHGLGGNYVEISIDAQHLWVYRDGEVVCDTDVVTGLPIHGSITYHGCYAIKKKQTDVTLGELDVQGYASPVSYWIPFNGGEGIHDAPWREYFGGRIWLTNGSHGCVNVPDWCMDDIYNNVEVGEAVVVYGSEYDESVNQPGTKTVNEEYYYDVFYGGQ